VDDETTAKESVIIHSVTHEVKHYISNAISKYRMGEEIKFDVTMAPMMGQHGLAGFSIIAPIFIHGALLGEWITGTLQVVFTDGQGGGVLTKTQEGWDELVRETLEEMRQERTRALAQGNGGGLISPP
jgi:hypothetical protein